MPRVTGIYGMHTPRGIANENENLYVVHVWDVVDFRRLKKQALMVRYATAKLLV